MSIESQTGKVLASATSPENELVIIAKESDWAEQEPAVWWEHVKESARQDEELSSFFADRRTPQAEANPERLYVEAEAERNWQSCINISRATNKRCVMTFFEPRVMI